jgi:hypothetical protein
MVAGAVFSTRRWFDEYGKVYYNAANYEAVQRWCLLGLLPSGWDSIRHGNRFFIYYVGASRKQRRRLTHKSFDPPAVNLGEKAPEEIKPELVAAAFKRLFFVSEWVEKVGRPLHRISSVVYAHQLASGRPNERAGHTPARLPDGWHSVRVGGAGRGGTWLIYRDALTTDLKRFAGKARQE